MSTESDHDGSLKNGQNHTDNDDTVDESILPPITPAILEEYQKEVELREAAAAAEGRLREHKSPLHVCGIPSCLVLVLIVLIIAVIVGTIMAVLFYSTEEGVLPPSDAPSMVITSMEPS
jgi:hypothetical protein